MQASVDQSHHQLHKYVLHWYVVVYLRDETLFSYDYARSFGTDGFTIWTTTCRNQYFIKFCASAGALGPSKVTQIPSTLGSTLSAFSFGIDCFVTFLIRFSSTLTTSRSAPGLDHHQAQLRLL